MVHWSVKKEKKKRSGRQYAEEHVNCSVFWYMKRKRRNDTDSTKYNTWDKYSKFCILREWESPGRTWQANLCKAWWMGDRYVLLLGFAPAPIPRFLHSQFSVQNVQNSFRRDYNDSSITVPRVSTHDAKIRSRCPCHCLSTVDYGNAKINHHALKDRTIMVKSLPS